MSKHESAPEQANPYEAFNSPSSMVSHILEQEPENVSWKAVAERAVVMEGQDGAASLAVLALDRHLRSHDDDAESSRASMEHQRTGMEHQHLDEVATRITMAMNRGEDIAGTIIGANGRFEQTADEAGRRLTSTVNHLEELAHPYGTLGKLGELTSRLEETLSYHKIERLSDVANGISVAANRLDQHRF